MAFSKKSMASVNNFRTFYLFVANMKHLGSYVKPAAIQGFVNFSAFDFSLNKSLKAVCVLFITFLCIVTL